MSDPARDGVSPLLNNQESMNKDQHAVQIVNGCFAWKTDPILFDLNIEIPRGILNVPR